MMFLQPGGGEGIDTDALSKLLEGYTTKDEFKDLMERVEKLEKDVKELDHDSKKCKKKIKKNKEKLKDHSHEIDELKKKKVSQDEFDSEITFIKNLLNKYSGDKLDLSSLSPQFTSGEVSKLKEVALSYPDLEKNVEKILNDLK
jgi:chromosome segregation ATPase